MCVTFDSATSERNESERGLAFSLADEFEWADALVVEDTRRDYGERRYQAIGTIGGELHMPVFTPRDGAVHVISLRRANHGERTRHATQTRP